MAADCKPMGFEITTTRTFSASHQLKLYDGSLEPLHGHNWRVRITVSADKLDAIGVVMDFHALEQAVDQIAKEMHNRHLNDLPAFQQNNPSAEQVALEFGQRLKLPGHVTLVSSQVWETDENSAVYRP